MGKTSLSSICPRLALVGHAWFQVLQLTQIRIYLASLTDLFFEGFDVFGGPEILQS